MTDHPSARYALAIGRNAYAQGGVTEPVVTGPLLGTDGGRADTRAVSVPPGSFVIPADIVSGLPSAQGNSLAGHNALAKLFSALPLSPDEAPYGASKPKLAKANTLPGIASKHHLMTQAFGEKRGGSIPADHGAPVPIAAADGEYVVDPVYVKRLGLGDLRRGHEILDRFVDEIRKKHIKTLKSLPGTVKSGNK